MTGDEITLHCATINAVKVKVSNLHGLFAPDVLVYSPDEFQEYTHDDSPAPEIVSVVLNERDRSDIDFWRAALFAHAKEKDFTSINRAKEAIALAFNPADVASFCTKELIGYMYVTEDTGLRLITDYVSALILFAADVNIVDRTDSLFPTALFRAAAGNHKEACQVLLRAGADTNYEKNGRKSALSDAARSGHVEICEMLINAGADVHHEDCDKETPLFCAALGGHVKVCELLLYYDADVDHQNKIQATALFNSASQRNAKVCELLLAANANPNHKERRKHDCPLSYAALYGHIDVCRILLSASAEVDAENKYKRTAFFGATRNGHAGVCELLIAANCDVLHEDIYKKTALFEAASLVNNDAKFFDLLFSAGLDVNAVDYEHNTPLFEATRWGNALVCEILLKAGANVNHINRHGESALFAVARHDGDVSFVVRVCEVLLAAGAVVNLENADKQTALQIARQEGNANAEVERLLRS